MIRKFTTGSVLGCECFACSREFPSDLPPGFALFWIVVSVLKWENLIPSKKSKSIYLTLVALPDLPNPVSSFAVQRNGGAAHKPSALMSAFALMWYVDFYFGPQSGLANFFPGTTTYPLSKPRLPVLWNSERVGSPNGL